MPDWLDVTNAWAAVPLQLIGFGIAIWQIRKAKSAAESARDAATSAVDSVGANLLLVVLPQLVQVETNLEWAVANRDRATTIHYLGAWRWQAGQVRGLLGRGESPPRSTLRHLQASIAAAADAKLALQDPAEDVFECCRAVQKAIATVTGTIGELSAMQSLEGSISGNPN